MVIEPALGVCGADIRIIMGQMENSLTAIERKFCAVMLNSDATSTVLLELNIS